MSERFRPLILRAAAAGPIFAIGIFGRDCRSPSSAKLVELAHRKNNRWHRQQLRPAAWSGSPGMFVTLPDYRFHIPPGLAQPGAQYWRTLGISCNAAWFLLTLHPATDEGLQDTFLLTWDSDVADGIESMQREVASLLCIAPPTSAARNSWSSFAITEIWRATDPEQEDIPCVLFVGEDGLEYSGLFGSRAHGLARETLVARIKPRSDAANEGMCD